MELKLQSILFPDKEEYTDNADLFYKGGLGIRDAEEKCFVFSKYSTCDFGAYLNAFSMKKWKKHTKIGKTMLKLEIKGDFELVLSGYHRIENSAKRNVLLKKEYHCDQKAEIIVEIPSNKDTLIAFELRMYSECCVYGGGYYAEVNESDFNEVRLSIATTTFKKEDFIRKNVKMIKDEILTQDDIIGKNVYLHIVDNDEGRVLSAEEFEGPHIYYHRNKNVGGSGGFTRGMIESIRQKPKATHVLLMDDDVVVLSESIKRTYLLLLLAKEKYKDESVAIIDSQDRVHMAHMDIHYGFSVNGVAALHTDILKNSELKAFYQIYPEKFNNKTNGITFRRWLMHCNLELSEYISSLIGDSWKKDSSKLEKLLEYQNDTKVLNHFLKIKQKNKQKLCMHLKEKQDLDIDPNSIFDIQIKRLHEYKRQQLNALYAIYKYKQIKSGQLPQRPITMIFGAKAAPAYTLAKDIIHLILCLQKLTLSDPEVSPYLKVIMVENYNVTEASHLIPACDISEQISLASKEASGTGNMKFMLNGAVTLGTMDGANVEICNLVGKDNIYIFGKSSQEVIQLYETSGYHSDQYYDNDPLIQNLVDFIISKEMIRIGDPENLCRLYKDLISKDWFMTLLDLKEYIAVKENVMADYEDRMNWAGKMLINTAKAGYFSSDRTVAEYNRDIWKL